MAGITQIKRMPYFNSGPRKIEIKRKNVKKSFKDSKIVL